MDAETVPMPSTTQQMALNDTTTHDIRDILQRPVNLGTFQWSTSTMPIPIQLKSTDYDADTKNYLNTWNFPQAIFEKSPNVVDKLSRYQFFKAKVEIEIKTNAQPFLQGALLLVYNPYLEQTSTFRRKGTRFLASQTSCPYKILNLEEGNSVKLICPYANIYDLFDLGNSDNQFGTVYLYVLSTLSGVETEETVKYTAFARFVDPIFSVPTHQDNISDLRDQHALERLEKRGYRIAQSDVSPVASSDTGETTTQGPVSQVASGVATIAGALSEVPLIGSVASSVNWVSRQVAKTAAVFGWSKPTDIKPQSKVVVKPNSTLIHSEGNDDAVTLAMIQDNGIDGSSCIPETQDEMALSYVLARPNYFHAQTANTELFSANKLITAWEVSPLSQYQSGEGEDSQTLYLGSFAYASMLGTLWRGTINYDIMLIKTVYHQGRFAVVYLPETNIADVPPVLGDLLTTNYNVVCNLKDRQDQMGRTTVRVSVPYMSNTPWRQTYKRTSNTSNPGPDPTTLETKTGCLAIYSVVELSNPPTVSDQVTFYIAHSAGEDYQIARPTLQLTPGFQSRYAQSDTGPVFIPPDENLLVPSHSSVDVSAQTTGEYVKSLRQFVKRYGKFGNLKQSSDFVGFRTRDFAEDPVKGNRVIALNNLLTPAPPTPFYMCSFLYRFYHGSSQLKVIPCTPAMKGTAFLQFDENTDQEIIVPESETIGQPVFEQQQQMSNCLEVRTPFYRGVRCDVVGTDDVPILNDVRTCVRMQNLSGYGSTSQTSSMYEAAGDDFSFFFMVGPPPMCDIRNVRSVPSYPDGTVVTVKFSGITGNTDITGPPEGIAYFPLTVTGITPPATTTNYGITSSIPTEFTAAITGGTTQQIKFTDCTLTYINSVWQLRFVKPTNLDVLTTQANLIAIPPTTMRIGKI